MLWIQKLLLHHCCWNCGNSCCAVVCRICYSFHLVDCLEIYADRFFCRFNIFNISSINVRSSCSRLLSREYYTISDVAGLGMGELVEQRWSENPEFGPDTECKSKWRKHEYLFLTGSIFGLSFSCVLGCFETAASSGCNVPCVKCELDYLVIEI